MDEAHLVPYNLGHRIFDELLILKISGFKEKTNLLQIKNIAIITLYKLISKYFAPHTKAEVLVSFYKVWS